MRSKLKPPFILLKNNVKQKNEIILPCHVEKNINVFLGGFLYLKITQSMVGHRFADFASNNVRSKK
jgi:ribosomal protein S19